MFALLFSQLVNGYPNQIDVWKYLGNKMAIFNNCLRDAEDKVCSALTEKAFYGAIRLYDRNGANPKLILPNSKAGYVDSSKWVWGDCTHNDKICLYFDAVDHRNMNALEMQFWIKNFNDYPAKVDLGFYTNAHHISKGYNIKLIKKLNGDAVYYDAGDRNVSYLLRKHSVGTKDSNGLTRDVDTIYLGYWDPNQDASKYPYFENSTLNETDGVRSSAFGFSWQNLVIPIDRIGLQQQKYAFMVYYGDNYKLKPKVKDITPNKDDGFPKEFDLQFEVTEYEAKTVDLKIQDVDHSTNIIECGSLTFNGDAVTTKQITCTTNFKDNQPTFNYQAYAVTSDNIMSDKTPSKRIRYEHAEKPTLEITGGLHNGQNIEYGTPYINVEAECNDETYIDIYYRWDNKEPQHAAHIERPGHINFNVEFPRDLAIGAPHTLTIHAEDDLKIPSGDKTFNITYLSNSKPFIKEIYFNKEKLVANQKNQIIVYGEGNGLEEGSNVSVFIVIDGESHFAGNFTTQNPPKPFAMFVTLPEKPIGHANFTFYAEDTKSGKRSANATVTKIVYDPNAKQPPGLIGKIIESSDIKSSKALFNLKYNSGTNDDVLSMTRNDEGFFCKFRTYDGIDSTGRKEHPFNYSSNRQITEDNFKVELSISEEPNTHFLKVAFNVTNLAYFERRFDLSIFGDTGYETGKIQINDEDPRSIVVTNEFIRYTLYYSEYFDSIGASNHYTGNDFTRSGNNIPYETIPFFSRDHNKFGTQYGLSWQENVIPGESSRIFAIVFAGYDKVKTPTRLQFSSTWQDRYDKNGPSPEIEVLIKDSDNDENLSLIIKEYEKEPEVRNITMNGEQKTETIQTHFESNERYYKISIHAEDQDQSTAFPSNTIEKTVYLTDKPKLKVNVTKPEVKGKRWYNNQEHLTITGSVSDGDATQIGIYYRFLKAGPRRDIEGAERLATMLTEKNSQGVFEFNIGIPLNDERLITPSDFEYKIMIYARDGEVMSDSQNITFNLNERNPPNLLEAGFSKKSVKAGESILGYVVCNDAQNDYLEVLVKVGNDSKYEFAARIDDNPGRNKDIPFAYFWTVPANLQTGVYDVSVIIRDPEGSQSEKEVRKTLFVAGH